MVARPHFLRDLHTEVSAKGDFICEGVEEGQTRPFPARALKTQIESHNHPREDVDNNIQDRAADYPRAVEYGHEIDVHKRRVDLESCARPEDVLTRCSHYAAHAKIPCRRINVALSDCQVQIQLVNNAIKLPIRWRLMRRWLNRNSDAALLDVAGIEVLRLGVPHESMAGHQDEVLQCRLRPARQHHCSD